MKQPFIFELNFDLPDESKNIDHLEEPILYTQKDLDTAFNNGFEDGCKKGTEEGFVQGELKAFTDQQIQMHKAFLEINQKLTHIFQQEVVYEKTIQENVKKIVLNLAEKLLPNYIEQYGSQELLHHIQDILEKTMKSESIHVFINPTIVLDLKDKIEDIKNIFNKKEIKVDFVDDPSLPQWDARIEWVGGGARWNAQETLTKLNSIIAGSI
ncbi:MAG: hypothetical protein C0432_01070 [Candidatus Puniceispirillum sp.]|nr:hypothetical protein [Candidatus Pelagibacter sp.]MBA4282873.1 hypothetical protein [Candidatus Puniceispirillum sp.]